MKLVMTDALIRSNESEIAAFLRSLNRTARMAREERRLSKPQAQLAAEWGDRETGRVEK